MMVLTEVRLTTAQTQALRRLSVATGKSITELMRSAIDRYLSEGRASEAGNVPFS
jgi:predicted DNA-binding protein